MTSSVNIQICDALAGPGYAIIPHFFDAEKIIALNHIAQSRAGDFQPAGIGRGAAHTVRNDIRGDSVLWVEQSDPEMIEAHLCMEELKQTLNRELYIGIQELEWHFARYPAGSFYKRHLDQHRRQDTRVVTVVLYLNQDWLPEFGGQLRMYTEGDDYIDVIPAGGTLVVFISDKFEHEVLPATRERLSLTGWFRSA